MAKSTKAPTRKSGGPPDPRRRGEFRDWLAKQPRDWSAILASRAALRVLPLISQSVRSDNDSSVITLATFRASAITRAVTIYPTTIVAVAAAAAETIAAAADAAAAAAAASEPDAAVAAYAAYAVAYAAYAAAAATNVAAADAIAAAAGGAAAADAAHFAVNAAATATEALSAELKFDAQQLHNRTIRPRFLAIAPLWASRPPQHISDASLGLEPRLLLLGHHWSVWIRWYDDVLAGAAPTEDQNFAFTDISGDLPWKSGAEAANTEIARRLQALELDPAPVEGIPSPIAISRMPDGRIGAEAGALSAPTLPDLLTPADHAGALAACRSRAEQLRATAASPKFQGRAEYAEALSAYLDWLPSALGVGNILLADGEARVLNKLFTADESILPTGFAGRLSVLLEDHIGLRPHYPELERHYHAVRTGRLVAPLSRDAVEAIRQAIHANTPTVFQESVSPAMDETAKPIPDVRPPAPEDAPPPDPNRPKPPKDPIAEVDPTKSRNLTFASAANRIWEILKNGKSLREGSEGWQKSYEQFKPHIGTVLQWLKDSWPGGGDGTPPIPPMISA